MLDELPPNDPRVTTDLFPDETPSPDQHLSTAAPERIGRLSRITSRLKARLGRRQDTSPGSEIDPMDDLLDEAGVALDPFGNPGPESSGPNRDEVAKQIYDEAYARTIRFLKLNLEQNISPEAANAVSANVSGFIVGLGMTHHMKRETPEESAKREEPIAEGFKRLAYEVSGAAQKGVSEQLVLGIDESEDTKRRHSEASGQLYHEATTPYQYTNQGRTPTIPSESIDRIYDIFGVSRPATRGAHVDHPLQNEYKNTTVARDEKGKIVSTRTVTPAGIVIVEEWSVHRPATKSGVVMPGERPTPHVLVNQGGVELESEVHTITFVKAEPTAPVGAKQQPDTSTLPPPL